MQNYHEMICEVCDTRFKVDKWIGGNCPAYDQRYDYEEDYAITLTPEQVQLLRNPAAPPPQVATAVPLKGHRP
jgi:hypothetical protein